MQKDAYIAEHLRFESHVLRQCHRSGNSLRLFEREKITIYQRHLPNGLSTVPCRLRPIFPLSLAVFSAGWELRQFSTQLVI